MNTKPSWHQYGYSVDAKVAMHAIHCGIFLGEQDNGPPGNESWEGLIQNSFVEVLHYQRAHCMPICLIKLYWNTVWSGALLIGHGARSLPQFFHRKWGIKRILLDLCYPCHVLVKHKLYQLRVNCKGLSIGTISNNTSEEFSDDGC